MKITIYQPHHDQSQNLTPEFQGVLNPNIDDSDWHIQNYLGVCKIAETQDMDYWGTFNSNWQNLIPGYSASDIINHVNENPDHDVYVFTAYSFLDANIYNVWEQALVLDNCLAGVFITSWGDHAWLGNSGLIS